MPVARKMAKNIPMVSAYSLSMMEMMSGSHQQDADDGVLEFLQVKFPYGRSFGWSQQVGSMLGTAFPYLFVGQSDVIIVLFHCVEIYPFCFVRKCTTIIWDARCD